MTRTRWTILGILLFLLVLAAAFAARPAPEPEARAAPEVAAARRGARSTPIEHPPAALPPDGTTRTVWCLLPVEVEPGEVEVTVESPDGEAAVAMRGRVHGGFLEFQAFAVDGAGLVKLQGYERAGLVWFETGGEQDCLFPTDPVPRLPGVLTVTPVEVAEGGRLLLQIGERDVPIGPGPTELELAEGLHTVRTCVEDDQGHQCGPWHRLQVESGGAAEYQAKLWSNDFGGLGISVINNARGMVITRVEAGSAMAEIGAQNGDLILVVDGINAWEDGLAAYEALRDGTEPVEVLIERYDGGRETYVLERAIQ